MINKSPSFKFDPSEWLTGNIAHCSPSTKGLFIDICARYWKRKGDMMYQALTTDPRCDETDLEELIANDIISFNDGKVIIKFLDEQLTIKMTRTKLSLGSPVKGDSFFKKREKKKKESEKGKDRFKPPTVEDVSEYCQQRKNRVDPQTWIDFYQSKGWMVGSNKMKDWKAAVRTWERRPSNGNGKQSSGFNSGRHSGHKFKS